MLQPDDAKIGSRSLFHRKSAFLSHSFWLQQKKNCSLKIAIYISAIVLNSQGRIQRNRNRILSFRETQTCGLHPTFCCRVVSGSNPSRVACFSGSPSAVSRRDHVQDSGRADRTWNGSWFEPEPVGSGSPRLVTRSGRSRRITVKATVTVTAAFHF